VAAELAPCERECRPQWCLRPMSPAAWAQRIITVIVQPRLALFSRVEPTPDTAIPGARHSSDHGLPD